MFPTINDCAIGNVLKILRMNFNQFVIIVFNLQLLPIALFYWHRKFLAFSVILSIYVSSSWVSYLFYAQILALLTNSFLNSLTVLFLVNGDTLVFFILTCLFSHDFHVLLNTFWRMSIIWFPCTFLRLGWQYNPHISVWRQFHRHLVYLRLLSRDQ